MKKIGTILRNTGIIVWLVIAIFVTVCLLSYNDFKISTFGKYSLVVMDSDEYEPEYLEGDLLIIKRNSDAKINIGDEVFYYNTSKDSDTTVYSGAVEEKNTVNQKQTTYKINDKKVSGDYVIGAKKSTKALHTVGTILNIFKSKWGYMFLVIFPTLFATIYEAMLIIDTFKKNKKEEPKVKEEKVEELI